MGSAIAEVKAPWTTCGLCGRDIPLAGARMLPLQNGEVNWSSKARSPICGQCYSEATKSAVVFEDDGEVD